MPRATHAEILTPTFSKTKPLEKFRSKFRDLKLKRAASRNHPRKIHGRRSRTSQHPSGGAPDFSRRGTGGYDRAGRWKRFAATATVSASRDGHFSFVSLLVGWL